MTSPRRIARVLVTGVVQGVGYRAWTHHQAELRGLGGWVRNRPDGSVEAVFAGEPGAVELMIAACREGPRGSQVERVAVEEAQEGAVGRGDGFRVLATG